MTKLITALMSALSLPEPSSGATEWIHLLPESITTRDGRGPYRVVDADSLISASFADQDKLYLDENHATDTVAKHGGESPARGWITALQHRQDGIWGRVEWTPAGRELIETHAYRYISPVIGHTADGRIMRIIGASLVNKPNLRGLTALHQEGGMPLRERLAELIGLNAEASEDEILQAVGGLANGGGESVALQAQMTELRQALGVTDADHAATLAAARRPAGNGSAEITALQSELTQTATALNTLREGVSRDKATAFVDAHLNRAGVKPLRDHYISRHMADAASVEKELAALPVVGGGITTSAAAPEVESTHLADPQQIVARANAYLKRMTDAGQSISYAAAVRAVQDGKDKA